MIWLMPFGLAMLIGPYFVLRWRDDKQQPRDPDLGIKFGLHFLLTIAILLLVTGVSIIAADFLLQISTHQRDFTLKTGGMRTGFALTVAGAFLAPIFFYMVWTKTNDALLPSVRRFFIGSRFIVSGMVSIITLATMLIDVFQDRSQGFGSSAELVMPLLGVFSVWGTEMCLSVFFLMTSRPRSTAGI